MPVGFIEHQGVTLAFFDFAGIQDTAVLLNEIEDARRFVAAQPKRKELLTLVDVKGLRFNEEVIKAFRELTKHNEPWQKAVAVHGFSPLGRIAFRAVNLATGGRLMAFEDRESALAWLLQRRSEPT